MYRDAAGLSLPDDRTQRYGGAKWINLLRDLQSGWYYWRRGELTIVHWIRSMRGPKAYAIFSWSDPGPFIAAVTTAVLSPFRKSRAVQGSARNEAS